MNIIDKLIAEHITDNPFHAAGMLNVLECVKLDTDAQRVERCRLYVEWKKYLENSKEFTNKKDAKLKARKYAMEGWEVPELPMLEALAEDYSKHLQAQAMSDMEVNEVEA